MKKIVYDPGHGGDQPGATYNGIEEEDITLGVCLRAANVSRGLGYEVLLTRDKDKSVSLTDRLNMIDKFDANVFVSVHMNATIDSSDKQHGIEAYYHDDGDITFANVLYDYVAGLTGLKMNGCFKDETRLKKRLTVLGNKRVPAVLLEMGYLSNSGDSNYITNNMNTIGEIIANGVDHYFRNGVKWPYA